MGALSLRLPDHLDNALSREAELETKPRSEVVRHALAEYLQRMERERFMANMVNAAIALANDPASQRESLEIVETTVGDGLNTILASENEGDIHSGEKWWK
ncbi:ribbon-helix-helix protein, CopG family [Mariprofundus ferrooxydans]|nr:ribbon-helix-helix protein, CopG family [Mariprofundus ferrooxydans]